MAAEGHTEEVAGAAEVTVEAADEGVVAAAITKDSNVSCCARGLPASFFESSRKK